MAELPISHADAGNDIKALILEKGIESLTSKIIRKHLEAKYNCSLSANKSEIDKITVEKIAEVNKEKSSKKSSSSESGSDDQSEEEEDDDEDGNKSKPEPSTKASRKRKASSEDDSDFDAPTSTKPSSGRSKTSKSNTGGKKRKDTAFTRLCELSDELQAVVGRKYMRRHDVVKAMWAYFKNNDLMDPKDRRKVICDEPLRRIFGIKKIQAFGMMGVLKDHITVAENLDDDEREKILDELDPDRHNQVDSGDTAGSSKKTKAKASKQSKKTRDAPRRETAFTMLMTLSDDLADVLGHKHMRRYQVVKAMWAYFKEHDLMDPANRRMVILDDAMKPIFDDEERIQAFGMMRYLKGHMEPAEISDTREREKILTELDLKYGKDDGEGTKSSDSSKSKKKPEIPTSESSTASSANEDDVEEKVGQKNGAVPKESQSASASGSSESSSSSSDEDDD